MVKSGNSCEDMLAVGRLKLEREAVELEVRDSWKGKSEGGGLEGSGWLWFLKEGMVRSAGVG